MRWVTTYLLKLAPIPAESGDIRLRHRIQINGNGSKLGNPVWLDTVVRRQGQKTSFPQVSSDPHLVFEGWKLEEKPPIENRRPMASRWRLALCFRKKGLLSEKKQYAVNDNLHIRDASRKKGYFNSSIEWTDDPQAFFGYGKSSSPKADPNLSFLIHEFNDSDASSVAPAPEPNSKLKPPLWIEGEAKWNDNWPIHIKIPLRDARGQILLTPRPAPAFRVLSASVRAVSPQKSSQGIDTIVQVVLQATKPGADVSKWHWEGHFSQHVQDAKGRKHWLFPFQWNPSQPPQPASVSYETSQPGSRATLSYALILSSIPKSAGALTFHAQISANGSRRVPVSVKVRPPSPIK